MLLLVVIFTGLTSLASNPIAAAVLKVDKSQYPQFFDTIVSSSIDSIHARVAPRENVFSSDHFGFNPIASQNFHPPGKSARLAVAPPRQHLQAYSLPNGQQLATPLRYDIRTVHDADYKVYKPEENEQGENGEILAALKKNPSVASYFKPAVTNLEVSHPFNYRKEDVDNNESLELEQNYKPNAYITGPARIRRYTSGRQRQNVRKNSDEEEDPYSYRPKAFDSGTYSAYTEEKDPNKEYDYPYGGYDSGYDHKSYERIKELSEKQAAEIKQNPGNCKEVKKDGMTCMTCKDPKTGGNYESCSYVAEPKNNQYAYSKEKKFDSNDEPDEPESEQKPEQPKRSAKYEKGDKEDSPKYEKLTGESSKPYSNYKEDDKDDDDSGEKYKGYYIHSSKPSPSEALRASSESENPDDETESVNQPYNYKKALPGFYTENEPKKDVEHVLAEFKKKDRSSCKKVQKNGMTCFQCIDKSGLKNEECMYVSESAPKASHLAYQEVKEFTSKPATLNNEGAASHTITTSAPLPKSAAYVVENSTYGKKLKRKKAPQTLASSATKPIVSVVPAVQIPVLQSSARRVKRSVESEADTKANIKDETNIPAPEEFSGDSSKGAFWAETQPRYSAALGVTLPEYMLSRSEHEVSFDETIAGA